MWIFNAIANAVGKNFIGTPNYLFGLLFNRVKADGGVTEAQQCTIEELTELQNDNLLSSASLIVTPNAYKEGKLYSVIPSDGSGDLSVTRATTATRVNSAGLVELVPYNLVTYSEQFDNSDWLKFQASVTANSIASPNGTLTADSLVSTTTSTAVLYRSAVLVSQLTISVYAKAGTSSTLNIGFTDGIDYTASINLSTGAIISVSSGITATITNEGNGWYRCTATRTMSSSGNIFINNSTTTSGAYLYLWGAQLNEGTIKPYQRTETRLNIPRLDYSNGSCPSLLVEPQRTNTLQYSSQFDNAVWEKYRCDIGINAQISPSGIQDADTMTSSVGETILPAISDLSTNFIGNTRYSASLFVKKIGTADTFKISYVDNVINFAGGGVTYNVVTQAITITQPANNSITASIEDYGNGWYRLIINFLTIATPTFNYIEYSIPTVSTTNTFALWGAQLEVGAYPTSYIPTTSASVTRNADVVSKTGITSLIGQTEGTLFYEGSKIGLDTSEFYLSDGTYDNHIRLQYFSNTNIIFGVLVVGGAAQCVLSTSAFTVSDNLKIALKYKANDFALWVNGTEVATDTSGTTFAANTLNRINLGQPDNSASGVFKGNVKALALWKTALTNTQLAELTTL